VIIETSKGPIDESELDREVTRVDTDRVVGLRVDYRLKGTPEIVATMHKVDAWKYDRLTEVTALSDDGSTIGVRKLADLDVTFGSVDNENEYTWWIEYRLKGTDKVVSKEVNTTLKRPGVSASGAVGGF
jgi:hypothetical protein